MSFMNKSCSKLFGGVAGSSRVQLFACMLIEAGLCSS